MTEKKFEVTGTGLKLLAVITMFIDHVASGLFRPWVNAQVLLTNYDTYNLIYKTMRGVGRLAFPIYCFMLVEGFFHTRSIKKYALRLLGVAVVSELIFDKALKYTWVDFTHNNVLWELLLGLGILTAMDTILNRTGEFITSELVRRILMVAVLLVGMVIAYFAKLDYKQSGIACIGIMYFLYGCTTEKRTAAFAAGVAILTLMSSETEIYALAVLPLMYLYRGSRGRDSKALRVFFYGFYPVHLLLIYALRLIIVPNWG